MDKTQEIKKVAIIGLGAIGVLVGHRFSKKCPKRICGLSRMKSASGGT